MSDSNNITKVWNHCYSLNPLQRGNHRALYRRQGCLLKIEYANGRVGYSDLHPWPELGDPILSELLKFIGNKETHPLLLAAYAAAQWDSKVRSGMSPQLRQLLIPQSHYLLPQPLEVSDKIFEELKRQGYSHVKLKMGCNLELEGEWLQALSSDTTRAFKWRLDFNQSFQTNLEFANWCEKLPEDFLRQVDFFEDPVATPFVASKVFWDVSFLTCQLAPEAQVVIKPSRCEVENVMKYHPSRKIFTHAMGHPLGQIYDMLRAAETYSLVENADEVCGLQCRNMYHSNEWSERIIYLGPQTSLNFDSEFIFSDLLKELAWVRLQ